MEGKESRGAQEGGRGGRAGVPVLHVGGYGYPAGAAGGRFGWVGGRQEGDAGALNPFRCFAGRVF